MLFMMMVPLKKLCVLCLLFFKLSCSSKGNVYYYNIIHLLPQQNDRGYRGISEFTVAHCYGVRSTSNNATHVLKADISGAQEQVRQTRRLQTIILYVQSFGNYRHCMHDYYLLLLVNKFVDRCMVELSDFMTLCSSIYSSSVSVFWWTAEPDMQHNV